MNIPHPQYLESIRKGFTVGYGGNTYRVQDDGRGWLHINVAGKKIAIKDVDTWFEYGSYTDWIFNGWYRIYPEYEVFKQYAETDRVSA